MAHTFLSLLYHIIFSTHDRLPRIQPDIRDPLFRYMAGIVKHLDGKALLINGMPDHVHLLCRLRAAHPLAEVVQKVKANSSRWVHNEHGKQEFQWQEGYGAFTVSVSQQQRVYDYIANQGKVELCCPCRDSKTLLGERDGPDTPDSRPGLELSCP